MEIPTDLTRRQRKQVADLVIEHIVDRTQRGLDKDGKRFPSYSPEYIRSLDFKNAGKSKGRVDLQLSGDMLAALQLLTDNTGKIVVGYERGTEENARAEGNILGSYGGEPNEAKARNFLGIKKRKLDQIVDYVRENPE